MRERPEACPPPRQNAQPPVCPPALRAIGLALAGARVPKANFGVLPSIKQPMSASGAQSQPTCIPKSAIIMQKYLTAMQVPFRAFHHRRSAGFFPRHFALPCTSRLQEVYFCPGLCSLWLLHCPPCPHPPVPGGAESKQSNLGPPSSPHTLRCAAAQCMWAAGRPQVGLFRFCPPRDWRMWARWAMKQPKAA